MTEQEWLTGSDPQAMLRLYTTDEMPWITGHPPPVVSHRKLRLFAVACYKVHHEVGFDLAERENGHDPNAIESAMAWARFTPSDRHEEPAQRAALVRDIFGNPFRPVELLDCTGCEGKGELQGSRVGKGMSRHRDRRLGVVVSNPACDRCLGFGKFVPWLSPCVLSLAEFIYDNRAFEDMPILADALEEAGCAEEAILRHCRQEECRACGGEGRHEDYNGSSERVRMMTCRVCNGINSRPAHVRGCWVLDLILGNR